MAVMILIKRNVPITKEVELLPLLIQLRTLAMARPGYITGETLRNIDNTEECLVMSNWKSLADWEEWLSSRERAEVQDKIDALLGEETQYQIYQHP